MSDLGLDTLFKSQFIVHNATGVCLPAQVISPQCPWEWKTRSQFASKCGVICLGSSLLLKLFFFFKRKLLRLGPLAAAMIFGGKWGGWWKGSSFMWGKCQGLTVCFGGKVSCQGLWTGGCNSGAQASYSLVNRARSASGVGQCHCAPAQLPCAHVSPCHTCPHLGLHQLLVGSLKASGSCCWGRGTKVYGPLTWFYGAYLIYIDVMGLICSALSLWFHDVPPIFRKADAPFQNSLQVIVRSSSRTSSPSSDCSLISPLWR